jgi:hypothetical protein
MLFNRMGMFLVSCDVKWVLHCLALFKMVESTSILAVKSNVSIKVYHLFDFLFISHYCTFVSSTCVKIQNFFLYLTFIWVFFLCEQSILDLSGPSCISRELKLQHNDALMTLRAHCLHIRSGQYHCMFIAQC